MRQQGRITTWRDDRGYGYITRNGGGEPIFLHIKALGRGQARPVGEEIVTYRLWRDKRGQLLAEAVAYVPPKDRRTAAASTGRRRWPPILCALFFAFLALDTLRGKLSLILPAFYVVASLIAFVAYAMDKSAARNGRWRTRESTLHLLALLGGWPGAWLAQWQLRHKSAKSEFLVVFWATVAINGGLLVYWLTPSGGRVLRTLLGDV
ncbi:MAG: DUF1294 domain-containing protein [Bacteroidota bacterium]